MRRKKIKRRGRPGIERTRRPEQQGRLNAKYQEMQRKRKKFVVVVRGCEAGVW